MAERITRKQVDGLAEFVNRALRGGIRVVPEGRYGYTALDLYDERGPIRTLRAGTAREVHTYLRGMMDALDIVGRDVS